MATKKYESMRIISLEGSVLYKNMEGFTALKNGKPDSGIFRGVLDESLDTLKLKEVYERHKEAIRFPYIEGKKRFCRAVVNLSFNRAKVLARLRHYRQTFKKKNGGNLPAFYKYIVGDESKDIGKNTAYLQSPMSFVHDLVEACPARAAHTQTLPISELFELDATDAGPNDTHKKQNIIEAVKEAHTKITAMQVSMRRHPMTKSVSFAMRPTRFIRPA